MRKLGSCQRRTGRSARSRPSPLRSPRAAAPRAARSAKSAPGGSTDPASWPADDRSMCDYKHPGLEIERDRRARARSKPNVRRVYKHGGPRGMQRRKTLVCREIDTNLDGIKDVVRSFNAKGEPVREDADTNYDGKIDSWSDVRRRPHERGGPRHQPRWSTRTSGSTTPTGSSRAGSGIATTTAGRTSGRSTPNGHLERVGYDDDYDGHVDRWDRDDEVPRQPRSRARRHQQRRRRHRRSRMRRQLRLPQRPTPDTNIAHPEVGEDVVGKAAKLGSG